jgi:hypothetical protein
MTKRINTLWQNTDHLNVKACGAMRLIATPLSMVNEKQKKLLATEMSFW